MNRKEQIGGRIQKDHGRTIPDKKFKARLQVGNGEANYWPKFVSHKAQEVDVFTQKAFRKSRIHKS